MTSEKRHESQLRIFYYCIRLPDEDKDVLIESLTRELDVVVPTETTPDYSAMNWSEILEMRKNNIQFGSHTVSHPILSKVSEFKLWDEVFNSKKVLENRLNEPVSLFSYPNGDYSDRVISALKRANYLGAVTAEEGVNSGQTDSFKLKRIGVGEIPIYRLARMMFFPLQSAADRKNR